MINPEENLCWYDPRHPDNDPENGSQKENCSCDACFYGRHKLAEQIIVMRDEIVRLLNEYDISRGGVIGCMSDDDIRRLRKSIQNLAN